MKIASNISFLLFLMWVLLAIVDVWFDIVPTSIFIKLTITLGLLAVVALVVDIRKRKSPD